MSVAKLCVFCPHFRWERPYEASLSEVTWDSGGGASCAMGYYAEACPSDEADLQELLKRAETCSDYAGPTGAKP